MTAIYTENTLRELNVSECECVEVVGLPLSIAGDQLKNRFCRVLKSIGANVTDEKIEACHQVNKYTVWTIIKFWRRKDNDKIMRIKSELEKLNPADLNFPEGKKLYINENLWCPY